MADYQRFVSYIYSYPGGVRDKNVGFAKVEIRTGEMRLNINLRGVYTDTPQMFGIHMLIDRDDSIPGRYRLMKVGDCIVNNGMASYAGIFNAGNIDNTGYASSDICGIAVANKGDRYYMMFSMWEDYDINPDVIEFAGNDVRKYDNKKISENKISGNNTSYVNISDYEQKMDSNNTCGINDTEKRLIYTTDNNPKMTEHNNSTNDRENRTDGLRAMESENNTLSTHDNGCNDNDCIRDYKNNTDSNESAFDELNNRDNDNKDSIKNINIDSIKDINIDSNIDINKEKSEASIVISENASEAGIENKPDNKGVANSGLRAERRHTKKTDCINRKSEPDSRIRQKYMNSNEQLYKKLYSRADYVDAFDDDYFYDCIEVTPQMLSKLPLKDKEIINNSFLIHGYYNFHHLLFGRVCDNENNTNYFIGVPGMYCNRERYMASMFGFSNFKKSHRSDYNNPYFGYWYQEI